MPYSLETLAALLQPFWAVLLVSLRSFNPALWLQCWTVSFVGPPSPLAFEARRERLARAAASTIIEGYSIDSLNMANLRRRLDRDLVVQEADHTAHIQGQDLTITWKYSGYCRTGRASAFDFSIDSGAGTSFEELKCVAYDLGHDPEMLHTIRPILVGPEGISKKISVPLLEPLKANESFGVFLKCTLPRCLTDGTAYYTSTLSFAQDRVEALLRSIDFRRPGT